MGMQWQTAVFPGSHQSFPKNAHGLRPGFNSTEADGGDKPPFRVQSSTFYFYGPRHHALALLMPSRGL
jgi:hypothetical protein